jgi:hypothetical protein
MEAMASGCRIVTSRTGATGIAIVPEPIRRKMLAQIG